MIRSHDHNLARKFFLVLALTVFLPVAFDGQFGVAAQTGSSLPIPAATPAASIKRIMPTDSGATFRATVIRSGVIAPATQGLLLFKGDVIETENAKVTVLFLDSPYPARDNEVIIDANSRVGISSTYSWWGTVWAKVKGAFSSKTTYAQAGAGGTEYEFTVLNPAHSLIAPLSATLVVLEGSVDVTEDTFEFVARNAEGLPRSIETEIRHPQLLFASFVTESAGQDRFSRSIDVPIGQITPYESTYHLHNDCKQRHRIEFRTSDSADWLSLQGERTVQIEGGKNLSVSLTISVDATRLSLGRHEAHIYAICVDCTREAQCPEQQLDYALSVNVLASSQPTPKQKFTVRALEESPVTREFDQPSAAPTPRITSVLDWTNQVMLNTQPTYSAQNLIPHFNTTQERSQSFITARARAILANEPGSHAILGDVYNDWGQGAWASFAYEREVNRTSGGQAPPRNFSADLGEAYRLAGRLEEAARVGAAILGDQSPRAQNFAGNLALDRARIAFNSGNTAEANARIEEAKRFYAPVLVPGAGQRPPGAGQGTGTVQANLAEANVVGGDLALQNKSAPDARARFAEAVRWLESIQSGPSIYPFPITDLGVAYRGLGDAAVLSGDSKAAADSYARAQRQHEQAIAAHQDFGEAYFNLGDLFDDMGERDKAKANYRLAIQSRPEQPAAYYPLAMLIQDEDRNLAAALAATYLKLEREVFLSGPKADNARQLANRNPVSRPPRIAETIKVAASVPNVVNMTQNDAINALRAAGFVANIQTRTDPRSGNVVLEQKPAGGSPAQRGSTVDIVVNNTGLIVPDVLGKREADARAAIESAGLLVRNVGRRNDPKAVGTVLEQRPAAGSSAERGSAIEIVVSGGEPVVPNVLNMSETQARTAIENVGLTVGEVRTRSEDNKPKGSVVRQEPSAGRRVVPGSSVSLTVSAGRLVDVPRIINDREETAKRKIREKGLTVGNVSQRAVSQREGNCESVGKVLEQNNTPSGNRIEVGSTVNIVIGSVGEDPVTVPNFVGANGRDMAADRERRFTFARPRTEETDDAPPGTVIKQSPSAGTQFARDCPVTIELTVAEPLTSVGNYVGLSEAEARRQVSDARLSPVVRTRASQSQPGMVIDQGPPAGSRVRRSFPITLVVSVIEVPPVLVPEVEKKSLSEAKNILEGVGLRLGRVTYVEREPPPFIPGRGQILNAPQSPECTVTRQDPIKDRPVQPGTPVNVWVIRLKGSNVDCLNPPRGPGDH